MATGQDDDDHPADLESRGTPPRDRGSLLELEARVRVCAAILVLTAWTIAYAIVGPLGGQAPPAELSAAFLAVVAYLLGTGAKKP